MSMLTQATRQKLTFPVPPWALVRVAVTDEEKAIAASQYVRFVKGSPNGVRMADAQNSLVAMWISTSLNDLVAKNSQFARAEGNPDLSEGSLRLMIGTIVEETGLPVSCDDIFRIVFPSCLAVLARGARNRLGAKSKRPASEIETDGVVYRTEGYWTYVMPIEAQGQQSEVTVAFHEVVGTYALGPTAWFVMRDSPDNPTLIYWVDPDRPPCVSPTTALEPTEVVEQRAIAALTDAIARNGLDVEVEEHHPNGTKAFPECRLVINGQEWIVEVTRVLGNIVGGRVITLDADDTEKHVSRASKAPPLAASEIHAALRKALNDKAVKDRYMPPNAKYCVVLVDTLEALDTSDPEFWSKFDLHAFDAVAVARIEDGSPKLLDLVKGNITAFASSLSASGD